MAKAVQNYLEDMGISWKPVLAYAPMSNGRGYRMVGIIKHSITKIISGTNQEWDQALSEV